MDGRCLWVRRWLVSPVRARKARPHVKHMRSGADVAAEAALAPRTARLVCASLTRPAPAAPAPDDSPPLHAGRSFASAPHVLWSTPRFLKDMRQSLKCLLCPPTERPPQQSSPHSSRLGNMPSGIPATRPAHTAWAFSKRVWGGDYVIIRVSLSVCLSLCDQFYSKTTGKALHEICSAAFLWCTKEMIDFLQWFGSGSQFWS